MWITFLLYCLLLIVDEEVAFDACTCNFEDVAESLLSEISLNLILIQTISIYLIDGADQQTRNLLIFSWDYVALRIATHDFHRLTFNRVRTLIHEFLHHRFCFIVDEDCS